MVRKSQWLGACGVLVCAAISGCTEPYFCETIVSADGSAVRTVIEPFQLMPDAVRDPAAWDQYAHSSQAPQLERWGWPESLTGLPPGKNSPPFQFVIARKTVHSVDQIPDHLVIEPPKGVSVPAGRLIREYARTDYGFLVEHR
jgi:hypothetical protein